MNGSYADYLCVPLVKFMGKPDAGNPHVLFDEGEGSPLPTLPTQRENGSLVLKQKTKDCIAQRRRGAEKGLKRKKDNGQNRNGSNDSYN